MSWFGPVGDCSCVCRCDELSCGDGTTQPIKQISFVVDLPDVIEDWTTASFNGDKRLWKGVSALNGTYVVNRKPWPDCGWDWPDISIGITKESYNNHDTEECVGESRFCPIEGTHSFFNTETVNIKIIGAGPTGFQFGVVSSGTLWMKFTKSTDNNCGIQEFELDRNFVSDWIYLKADPCSGSSSCYVQHAFTITGEFLA